MLRAVTKLRSMRSLDICLNCVQSL